ncbi:porin [Rhodobacterales bacterium HKCCE2091]|nr:porin [Rhodobacterales bacterium HKCCE2091]
MKKVLFATTALVATAGAAVADTDLRGWSGRSGTIEVRGDAEMGIVSGLYADLPVQFWNDVDLRFRLTGMTDNGLEFGAQVDLDEAGNLGRDLDNQGTHVYISGAFGTLTLGDTDGALDFVMQDANTAHDPGSIADDHTSHAGYLGSYGDGAFDNQVLRYDYSMSGFTFAISYEQAGVAATGIVPVAVASDGTWALGLGYEASWSNVDFTFGLGYQSIDVVTFDVNMIGVSVLAEFSNGLAVVVGYTDIENGAGAGVDDSHTYVGVGYSTGPITLHANYGEFDSGASGYGVAAGYDLGGGLSILAGYGYSDFGATDADSFSFGLSMAF